VVELTAGRAPDLPRVTVSAGGESLEVTGRAAQLIYEIAVNAAVVNADPVGKLVVSYAHEQLKLEQRRSLPTRRLDRR
jgi:hypothetical protein